MLNKISKLWHKIWDAPTAEELSESISKLPPSDQEFIDGTIEKVLEKRKQDEAEKKYQEFLRILSQLSTEGRNDILRYAYKVLGDYSYKSDQDLEEECEALLAQMDPKERNRAMRFLGWLSNFPNWK